jgi:hypothetical protein
MKPDIGEAHPKPVQGHTDIHPDDYAPDLWQSSQPSYVPKEKRLGTDPVPAIPETKAKLGLVWCR